MSNAATDRIRQDVADPSRPGFVFDNTLSPESRQFVGLRGLSWHRMPVRVTVGYGAGYDADAVPDEIAQAVIEWCDLKKGLYGSQRAGSE